MKYSCAYQAEVQSALWSRKVLHYLLLQVCSGDSAKHVWSAHIQKKKKKNNVAAFVGRERLNTTALGMQRVGLKEVIWTDGPASELKNKYMVHLLQNISIKYNKDFGWKHTATSMIKV